MSKSSASHSKKICGTCEFWYGQRELDGHQRHAIFDLKSSGKCLGKHKNMNRGPAEGCSGWSKWSLLK